MFLLILTMTKGPVSMLYCKSEIVTVLFQNAIYPAGQCSCSESCDVGRFGAFRVICAVVAAVK